MVVSSYRRGQVRGVTISPTLSLLKGVEEWVGRVDSCGVESEAGGANSV